MNPIVWPGSASISEITDLTVFNFYDNDLTFVSESYAAINWVARRLGYPIMDVELSNENFVCIFEEAVNEYGAQINNFNIRENLLILQGSPTSSNVQGIQLRNSLGRLVKLTDAYGAEVGVGGDVTWRTGSIDIVPNVQTYDLDALWTNVSESGNTIRIKRIFHFSQPAATKFFDPFGFGLAGNSMAAQFGTGSPGPGGGAGIQYVLRPVYEDLLRMQSIEINEQVRKSGYGFEIINNKLRIFPIPSTEVKLWFQYVIKEEADLGYVSGSAGQGKVTDASNVPYQTLTYSQINSVGKQWIRNYFLALCKITLGGIRSKYQQIPVPDDTVTLDGETLRNEGSLMVERLLTELHEMLEKASFRAQMESKKEQDENLQNIINKYPMGIWIG
jgi:hypothetical protein